MTIPGPSIHERARGHWRGILAAAGLPAKALSGKHGPCPMCGGKDRFRLDWRHPTGKARWYCTHCGFGDGIDLLMACKGMNFADAARQVESHLGVPDKPPRPERGIKQLRDDMRKVWSAGRPMHGLGTVDMYLMGRGIVLEAYPTCIREAGAIRHKAGSNHPAMLALVRDVDGTAVNVHRTYLSGNGEKARVDPVRMLMRGGHPRGSAVRLMPHGDVLGIAEGIETAWSAAQLFDVPVWAALNAGRLEWWQPPRGVRQVLIFADNDENGVGQLAADKLRHRLVALGVSGTIRLPDQAGTDWNDVLMAAP